MSGGDSNNKTKMIPIRISPETHDRWQAWVDDPDTPHSSIAGTIRAAMNNFITDEDDTDDDIAARERVDADVDLTPIEARLETLADRLDDIEDHLVEMQTGGIESMDFAALVGRLFRQIPELSDPDEFPSIIKANEHKNPYDRAVAMSTADAYAEAYEVPIAQVERALTHLTDEYGLESVDESGVTRYYWPEGHVDQITGPRE